MGGVSSWCDLLVKASTEFDWQVLPIVAPHGRPPMFDAARPRDARSARIEVWSEDLPRRASAPWRPTLGRRAARRCWCATCWLGGRHRRGGRGLGLVPPAPRRRAAGVSLRTRLGGVPGRAGRGARRARARGRHAAGARPRRGGDALPDAVLGRAHRGGADAADRPAARHRRRLVGDPGGRPQGAARDADGADRARRLRARGLPGRRAQRRLAGQPLRRDAPGARAGAGGLRGRRRRLPGDRRQRLLGAGPRHRPRRRSSCSTTGCSQPGEPTPPPGTQTVVSVGRIDPLKDIHTMLRVAAQTTAHLPDARFLHYGAGAARRGGLRALVPGAARAARARRALPLHGPRPAIPTAWCATPTWC